MHIDKISAVAFVSLIIIFNPWKIWKDSKWENYTLKIFEIEGKIKYNTYKYVLWKIIIN